MCNVRMFVREVRQRLIDCYLQEWNRVITCKDRYAFFLYIQTNIWVVSILVNCQQSCFDKKPDKTETWCVIPETAPVAVFKNETGKP